MHPATDHMIHQSTTLGHAKDVTESITAEENVKWNIGRGGEEWTQAVLQQKSKNNKYKKIKPQIFFFVIYFLAVRLYMYV